MHQARLWEANRVTGPDHDVRFCVCFFFLLVPQRAQVANS